MRSKILITLMFVANLIFAQEPVFNYKALITDNSGNALSNHSVTIKFTIYNDDPSNGGTIEYQETHSLQTDASGIVVAEIGGGTSVAGNQIDDLNWVSAIKFLKTEFDIGDGNGFQEIDTKQFYIVPYAYFAIDAYKAQQVPYSGITNKPAWLADGDDDNQTLSVNGTQLTISNGNTVTLPTGSGGDQWGSQVVQSDASLSGDGTGASPLSVNTNSSAFNGWDKNAADDFSGNFDDLSNKPLTWKIIGGNNPSTSNTDDIFRMGKVVIGAMNLYQNPDHKLYINNSETSGNQHGVINNLSGGGTGLRTAIYNKVNNSGTGNQTGVYNLIRNSHNGTQTGTYNDMQLGGTGDIRGVYNKLTGNSNARQFGTYSLLAGSGNGLQAGSFNKIQSSGNGTKYGTYNKIDATAGGDHHYAVYGEALKTGSSVYAGYFKGNVKITKKLKSTTSGDADMKAYIYGSLKDSDGSAYPNESTTGFTSTKEGVGVYKITFSSYNSDKNYLVIANALKTSFPVILTYEKNFGFFRIRAWDINGNPVDTYLNFVVYKK